MENTNLNEKAKVEELPLNLDNSIPEGDNASLVKEFFVKESVDSIKELASLFGQSESELTKEFGSYKAKKVFKRINCFLDITNKYRDGIVKEMQSILKRGFYGVTVYSNVLPIAKIMFKDSNIKIRALINYPQGDEIFKTTKYATKQAIKMGADEVAIKLSSYEIKNGDINDIATRIKKLKKIVKNKNLLVIIDVNTLSITEIENAITKLSNLNLYAVCLNGEVDKPRILDAVSLINGKAHIECFTSVCVAEQAVSLLLSGVNVLVTDTYDQIVTDLNKKISGITGCDSQLLDKSSKED